jgi:hypothetical protein
MVKVRDIYDEYEMQYYAHIRLFLLSSTMITVECNNGLIGSPC